MKKIIYIIIVIILIIVGFFFAYDRLLGVENYILQEDIRDSKFIVTNIDSEGGCKLIEGKFCITYIGDYKFTGFGEQFPVNVRIELHLNKIKEGDVVSVLKNKFSVQEPVKGDWFENYFYIGEKADGIYILGWNSGSRLILIESFGEVENNDYFEDFLTKYINKYPSDIK